MFMGGLEPGYVLILEQCKQYHLSMIENKLCSYHQWESWITGQLNWFKSNITWFCFGILVLIGLLSLHQLIQPSSFIMPKRSEMFFSASEMTFWYLENSLQVVSQHFLPLRRCSHLVPLWLSIPLCLFPCSHSPVVHHVHCVLCACPLHQDLLCQ